MAGKQPVIHSPRQTAGQRGAGESFRAGFDGISFRAVLSAECKKVLYSIIADGIVYPVNVGISNIAKPYPANANKCIQ